MSTDLPRNAALNAYQHYLTGEREAQAIIGEASQHPKVTGKEKSIMIRFCTAVFLGFILPFIMGLLGFLGVVPSFFVLVFFPGAITAIVLLIGIDNPTIASMEITGEAQKKADALRQERYGAFLECVANEIREHRINILKTDQETTSFTTDRGTITVIQNPESRTYELLLNGQRIRKSYSALAQDTTEARDFNGNPVMIREGYADLFPAAQSVNSHHNDAPRWKKLLRR